MFRHRGATQGQLSAHVLAQGAALPAFPRLELAAGDAIRCLFVPAGLVVKCAQFDTQIIALSRRNSNVRSLEMALGKGRVLTAACDASVGALQDALAKRGVNPTR